MVSRLLPYFLLPVFLVSSVASSCPPGTIYESSFKKCYKFYNSPSTFLSAEQTCNSIGGHLVAIESVFENFFVSGIASGAETRTSNFWIGANLLLTNSWSWTTNASMSYQNWASGEPNASNHCGLVRDVDSKWITSSCKSDLPFVCGIDPNAPVPGTCPTQSAPPTSSPSTCPPPTCPSTTCPTDAGCSHGYKLYHGNCLCYKYFATNLLFNDAKSSCAEEEGILASSPTPDVNEFLTSLPGINCNGYNCPYIGLYCGSSSKNDCKWADGSPLGNFTYFYYDNVIESHPPAYETSFAIVASRPDEPMQRGTWQPNDDARSYICQKPSTRKSELMASWKANVGTPSRIGKAMGKSISKVN